VTLWLQTAAPNRPSPVTAFFRSLGAFGLFALAILDSSPLPTFGGPDILIAILVSTRRNSWYECAAVAALGSTIGAYLTFHLARKAGASWLDQKFGEGKVAAFLGLFKKSGTGSLIASTAIPFPFPTSLFFAAAGASDYPAGQFVALVAVSRVFRYTLVGLLAARYGRPFTRILRHPTEHLGWLIGVTVIVALFIGAGMMVSRRLEATAAT
jgi:membrane protein YqaA with SNARE-associated domain